MPQSRMEVGESSMPVGTIQCCWCRRALRYVHVVTRAFQPNSNLNVYMNSQVKLLHEVSDEELRRELERREIAALTARESSQGAYFQVENNADDEMMSAPATVDKTSSSLIPVDSTPSPSDSVSVSIGAASQHEAAAPPKEEVKPDSLVVYRTFFWLSSVVLALIVFCPCPRI